MNTHIIHTLLFVCHIFTYAIIALRHTETQQKMQDLHMHERTQRKQMQDDITSSIQQLSLAFDNKLDAHLEEIRDEIEFNAAILDFLSQTHVESCDANN